MDSPITAAHALLTLLAARELELSDAQRRRVVACTDTDLFDAWITRAATAERTEDIFAPH